MICIFFLKTESFLRIIYSKSVIRISLCRTAKRNPNDRFGLNRYEKSDNVNRRYQNTATGDTKSPILSVE